jgi:hypothetical protein
MVAKRRADGSDRGARTASAPSGSRRARRLKSQAWFWTPEWQAKEREADEDIVAGRLRRFMSEEEFLRSLEEAALPDANI